MRIIVLGEDCCFYELRLGWLVIVVVDGKGILWYYFRFFGYAFLGKGFGIFYVFNYRRWE